MLCEGIEDGHAVRAAFFAAARDVVVDLRPAAGNACTPGDQGADINPEPGAGVPALGSLLGSSGQRQESLKKKTAGKE